MRYGSQIAPDGSSPVSHEIARCVVCQSVTYDVPVLLDGIPMGKVALRCPHCDDKRPLDPAVVRRIESMRAQALQAEAERATAEATTRAYRERAMAAVETKRRTDEQHRAQIVQAIQRFAMRNGRAPTNREMGHSVRVQVPGLPSRSLVERLFGSARQALEAAGIPVPDRRHGMPRGAQKDRAGRGMVMRRYAA